MKNKIQIIAFICVGLSVGSLQAQVVPDNYRQQTQQEMGRFADSIHDDFVRYLEHLWTEYKLFNGEPSPRDVKPVEQPQMDTTETEGDSVKVDRQVSYGTFSAVPMGAARDFKAPRGTVQSRDYTVPFYGREVSIALSDKVGDLSLAGIRERHVARYWKKLVESRADLCATTLDQQRRNLYLGDWGLFDLIQHFTATVYPNLPNEQAVLSVFILDAMHYDARVGRMDDRLVMLVNTGSKLYDIPYVEIEGVRYYAFGNLAKKGRLHTYGRQLKDADQPIDMHLAYSPRLGGALTEKAYSRTILDHKVTLRVNQPLMDFYARYPQTELPIYATAAMEEAFVAAIERELRPFVDGQTPVVALNNLLEFMQGGFKYQTDSKQFKREKNFFCEENFYYPANDCEDRAVLFARVVKLLLGYDVVLLEYKDHVSTAVHIPGRKVRGHHLDFKGKRYMSCDPTTLGAAVGDMSRKYRNKNPNIIVL